LNLDIFFIHRLLKKIGVLFGATRSSFCLNKEQSNLSKYNCLCGILPYTSCSRFTNHWLGVHSNSVDALVQVIIISHFLSNLIFDFSGLCQS
jgi:hypothetical protein